MLDDHPVFQPEDVDDHESPIRWRGSDVVVQNDVVAVDESPFQVSPHVFRQEKPSANRCRAPPFGCAECNAVKCIDRLLTNPAERARCGTCPECVAGSVLLRRFATSLLPSIDV
jgi:hypothetical protein